LTLHTNTDWQPPADLIFIGHLGGKYFLCEATPQDAKPTVLIVHESEVERIEIRQVAKSD